MLQQALADPQLSGAPERMAPSIAEVGVSGVRSNRPRSPSCAGSQAGWPLPAFDGTRDDKEQRMRLHHRIAPPCGDLRASRDQLRLEVAPFVRELPVGDSHTRGDRLGPLDSGTIEAVAPCIGLVRQPHQVRADGADRISLRSEADQLGVTRVASCVPPVPPERAASPASRPPGPSRPGNVDALTRSAYPSVALGAATSSVPPRHAQLACARSSRVGLGTTLLAVTDVTWWALCAWRDCAGHDRPGARGTCFAPRAFRCSSTPTPAAPRRLSRDWPGPRRFEARSRRSAG